MKPQHHCRLVLHYLFSKIKYFSHLFLGLESCHSFAQPIPIGHVSKRVVDLEKVLILICSQDILYVFTNQILLQVRQCHSICM